MWRAARLTSLTTTSIFTDGSKLDGKVGSAFVVFENDVNVTSERQKLADVCTVFQAEMAAISSALDYVATTTTTDVTIFSDSKSSLQAIANRSNTNPQAFSIHQKLKSLGDVDVTVKFDGAGPILE